MCKLCLAAVTEIFPEVPCEEIQHFLVGTTSYPLGRPCLVRRDLEDNRAKMTTDDYHECYEIADRLIDEALRIKE